MNSRCLPYPETSTAAITSEASVIKAAVRRRDLSERYMRKLARAP